METKQFTVQHEGTTVHVGVSPCCWMYPNHAMQIKVTAGDREGVNAESIFVQWPTLYADCTDVELRAKVDELLAQPHFVPELLACKAAWAVRKAQLDSERAADAEKERKQLVKHDAKQKAKGYTHRVDGWIHPASGDDRSFRMYGTNITEKTVKDWLKKQRSEALTDFMITTL